MRFRTTEIAWQLLYGQKKKHISTKMSLVHREYVVQKSHGDPLFI